MKKYVQDDDGNWHDAQNIDDYPTKFAGDAVNYRLVITNTGDQALTNVRVSDDKVDLAGLDPIPTGLTAIGGETVIPEIMPGAAKAVTIEYQATLGDLANPSTWVNNACAAPENSGVDPSCDPAGVIIGESTLAWEKVADDTDSTRLNGSEWSLTRVDAGGDPIGSVIAVTDCVESDPADCTGADKDPEVGQFHVTALTAGDYVLVETRAPAGYVLDNTPHEITIRGDGAFTTPIVNEQKAGLIIPLTGGIGTFGILLGAGIAGAIALLLAASRRRAPRI
nr:SpaA isopeptide-forming pilin-related protein [Leucobacter sp. cx-169]